MLPIILALRRQKQGESLNLKPAGVLQFQDSLDYRMRPHLKKKNSKDGNFYVLYVLSQEVTQDSL